MHDSDRHVFTDEFDSMCVLISLDMGITSANMRVTIAEPDCVWDELVLVPSTSDAWERLEERIERAIENMMLPPADHTEAA